MTDKKVKIMAVIPARGGSKGIPRKNIVDLGGKPLIAYTIEVARRSKLIDAAIVSTDDAEIAEVAKALGADVPFLRPAELARDDSSDIDYLKHALAWVEEHRGWQPEILAILQPTMPFRRVEDVDGALRFMIEQDCDSVRTLAVPTHVTPYKMWFLDDPEKGTISPVLKTEYYERLLTDVPRQKLRPCYWQPGVVIATRAKFVRQGRVFGPDLRGYVVDIRTAHDIDEPADLEYAEFLIHKQKKTGDDRNG
ncbi:MAG: acylneuraminate cytidylyltransferase family protein [Thermodesulfovibrionales bacterium]|nr:acylneuraminate cytidylyltransferase family protein [Thermodesulfovibrionales bacterium]